MVSKHLEHAKRQVRDCYGRFASPLSTMAPPPSCQEVGSYSRHRRTAPPTSCMQEVGCSSHRHTAPPSHQDEASSNDLVEIWVVYCTAPPPLHLGLLLRHAWWLLLQHMWRRFHPMTPYYRTPRATVMNAPRQRGELIYMNWF
jgi:hypothetical protein